MKHCYHCGRITAGDPLFCNACGRTFDRKLCPRLHVNPRSAEICSRCGSRELSSPQPKVSLGWKGLDWLLRMGVGALALFLGLFLVYEIFTAAIQTPIVQAGMLLIGCLFIFLLWIWGKLPQWLRTFIRNRLRRRKDRHAEE